MSAQQHSFMTEIKAINANNSAFETECQKCLATTQVLHFAAITQPVPVFTSLLIGYCEYSFC